LLFSSTETNAARRIWCERTIQRRELAASAVLPSHALAAHHGIAFMPQEPLQREQLPPTPNERGRRLRGQFAEADFSAVWNSSTVRFLGRVWKSCGSSFS